MKSQKGFGLVPILLILLLATAVGFTGYYVYNQQSNKKTDKSEVAGDATAKASPSPTATTPPKVTATPTVTPTPSTQRYLLIKEWGVKIHIPNSSVKLEYTIDKDDIVRIRTDILNSLSIQPDCYANSISVVRGKPNDYYIGTMGRSTDYTFKMAYDATTQDPSSVRSIKKELAGYLYVVPGYGGATCTDGNLGSVRSEESAMLEIVRSFNSTLEVI